MRGRQVWLLCAAVALALAIAVGILFLYAVPLWIANTGGMGPVNAAAERGRVRTAGLAFLAGLVTATGAIFTGLTFWLSRRGQATDRFTKAVEQLGHASVDVRLGGIHALGRLAHDAQAYHQPVVDVLSAYVREHARWTVPDGPSTLPPELRPLVRQLTVAFGATATAGEPLESVPDASADVQMAVSVLMGRNRDYDETAPEFDFAHLNLRRINFERGELADARFTGASLFGARFGGAQLQRTKLIEADLREADFGGADLTGAWLNSARLEGALLQRAEGLEKATLDGATFDPLTTLSPEGVDLRAMKAKPAGT